jgi:hypothetical protein
MKRQLIAFFLIFIIFELDAQIYVINSSLVDSTKKILYIGKYNKMKINLNLKDKNYELKFNNQILGNLEENSFYINPNQIGIDTLFVFFKKKCIHKEIFKVDELGYEKCILGNNLSNYLTVDEILTYPMLKLYFPNSFYKSCSNVYSFYVYKNVRNVETALYSPYPQNVKDSVYSNVSNKFVMKNTIAIVSINRGEYLTNYQIEEIKKLKKGDELIFKDIIVGCPNCIFRKFSDITIKIK